MTCVANSLTSSPEVQANLALFCTDNLQRVLSDCMQAGCNYTDQLGTVTFLYIYITAFLTRADFSNVTSQLCAGSVAESRSTAVAAVALVFAPIAILAVTLRLCSRISIARHLSCDDWLMAAATAILAAITILDVYNCLGNGFGRHVWEIDPSRAVSLMQVYALSHCDTVALIGNTKLEGSPSCV